MSAKFGWIVREKAFEFTAEPAQFQRRGTEARETQRRF